MADRCSKFSNFTFLSRYFLMPILKMTVTNQLYFYTRRVATKYHDPTHRLSKYVKNRSIMESTPDKTACLINCRSLISRIYALKETPACQKFCHKERNLRLAFEKRSESANIVCMETWTNMLLSLFQ